MSNNIDSIEVLTIDRNDRTKVILSEVKGDGFDEVVDIRIFKKYPNPITRERDDKFRATKRGVSVEYDILGVVIKGLIGMYVNHFKREYNIKNY